MCACVRVYLDTLAGQGLGIRQLFSETQTGGRGAVLSDLKQTNKTKQLKSRALNDCPVPDETAHQLIPREQQTNTISSVVVVVLLLLTMEPGAE